MSIATDWDHRIIDAVSVSLGGRIGADDDVTRLRASITSETSGDRENTLAEIAVAFIRWAQDLKVERQRLSYKRGGENVKPTGPRPTPPPAPPAPPNWSLPRGGR